MHARHGGDPERRRERGKSAPCRRTGATNGWRCRPARNRARSGFRNPTSAIPSPCNKAAATTKSAASMEQSIHRREQNQQHDFPDARASPSSAFCCAQYRLSRGVFSIHVSCAVPALSIMQGGDPKAYHAIDDDGQRQRQIGIHRIQKSIRQAALAHCNRGNSKQIAACRRPLPACRVFDLAPR